MKKKLFSMLLVFALVVASVMTIVACTPNNGNDSIDDIIAQGQKNDNGAVA